MIIIFDLDDTLYDEKTFVLSGFLVVAQYLENKYDIAANNSYQIMKNILVKEGRGEIFDRLLELNGLYSKKEVKKCINIYRYHRPALSLFPEAKEFLDFVSSPLYLVTDGHKLVQKNKVDALGIRRHFKKVYLTHQYGRIYAKPSTYCFEKIRNLEKCSWSEMVYVADNPKKDFVNLNPLGVHTIRVLTGDYKDMIVDPDFDAQYKISDMSHLKEIILEI